MEQGPTPIRILHVTFNMGIGGTEQVIRQLVTGLPSDTCVSCVACIDGYVGEIGRQLQSYNIPVFALNRSPGIDRELVRNLRSKVRELGIDVVHCHQYTPWFYGWLATLGTGTPVVFTEHGRFHPDRYRYKALPVNLVMAMTTSAIVAISRATRSALAKYEFLPKSRVQVLYNGIRGLSRNTEGARVVRRELGIPDGDFVMGTVARLDPVKNQRMMLEGFAGILEEYSDSWLLMVGDGPDRAMLEEYAVTLGVDSRVIFTGFRDQPADYLAAMDLFLLTSHTEGTSMTLLEAMSLGIPAIATAVGGNVEIVDQEKSGLLIPTEQPAALTDAIRRLRRAPDLVDSLRAGSLGRFEARFSISHMVAGYRELYRKALRGKGA